MSPLLGKMSAIGASFGYVGEIKCKTCLTDVNVMLLARNNMLATVSYLFDGMLSCKHYLFYSLSLIISCILLINRNCLSFAGMWVHPRFFQWGPCCSSFYFHELFFVCFVCLRFASCDQCCLCPWLLDCHFG